MKKFLTMLSATTMLLLIGGSLKAQNAGQIANPPNGALPVISGTQQATGNAVTFTVTTKSVDDGSEVTIKDATNAVSFTTVNGKVVATQGAPAPAQKVSGTPVKMDDKAAPLD